VKLTILGCGTSFGVPRVGNDWGAWDPAEPRNRRRRVSILVEHDGTRILVDTSPDLREQLLDAGIGDLDAVIWTHDHADHCHGIDDLRAIFHRRGAPLPGFARPETLAPMRARFSYAFEGKGGYPAMVDGRPLPDTLDIGPVRIGVADQPHGAITSAGLRFEAGGQHSIGYSTDCNELTEDMKCMFERRGHLGRRRCAAAASHPSAPRADAGMDWNRPPRSGYTDPYGSQPRLSHLLAELPAGSSRAMTAWRSPCERRRPGAQFLYLVGVLILVGSSFAVRRLPIAQGLKMLIGWVLIFGIAFIVFTLKDEFMALGNRMLIETRGGVEQTAPGEVRIRQAPDGHFWVTAEVNGKSVRFLVDSGATTTSLSRDTAQRVGIIPASGFQAMVQTANGVVMVDRGRADTIAVGGIARRDVAVHISDAFGDLDVIGMNFLSTLSGWSVEGRTLVLRS
jgi:phosphoribosyl 1,2-cyclic phosphate phosphodiesterase